MKEQFTPGDWSFETNESYIELHADDKQIGDLAMGSNTCTETEVIANAHLIAASKKLYYKLHEMELFMEQMHEADPYWTIKESQSHHKEIRELLAEARGEKSDTE